MGEAYYIMEKYKLIIRILTIFCILFLYIGSVGANAEIDNPSNQNSEGVIEKAVEKPENVTQDDIITNHIKEDNLKEEIKLQDKKASASEQEASEQEAEKQEVIAEPEITPEPKPVYRQHKNKK